MDHYAFVIPIIKALLGRCRYKLLNPKKEFVFSNLILSVSIYFKIERIRVMIYFTIKSVSFCIKNESISIHFKFGRKSTGIYLLRM